jgi:HK97 family phage portal protein
VRSPLGTILDRAPISYAPSGRLSLPLLSRNDATGQMRAYQAVSTLFAIVSRTSSACGRVDWQLYRKAASGQKEDRTPVARHAALDLWNRPNRFMTRAFLVEATQQHGDLTGEGWWVIGRDPRLTVPLELWPVRPDRIEPVPSATDFIAGYVYTGPDNEKVPLDVADVVMPIHMPNPLDPYRGCGPVQSLLIDLEASTAAAQWNRNFFRNSAEPGGVVETERRLTDDEFDEWQERWRSSHQGVSAAHRVAILESGMKWVDRKYTMREMEFSAGRAVTRDIIREAFGFPKSMLGLADDVNRAVAEAAEVMFGRWLVAPRLDRIKEALNEQLLPLFGRMAEQLEFDYDDPVPPDGASVNAERDSKVAALVALVDAGFDEAEVLAWLELPELSYTKPAPPAPLAPAGGDEPPAPAPPPE